MFMVGIFPSDIGREDSTTSKMVQIKMTCKNYTTGHNTIVVGDSQGMLANHIWSYVFRLAIQVR